MIPEVVVAAAGRSIIGSPGGSLSGLDAARLGGAVARGLLDRLESDAGSFTRREIGQLIVGLCVGAGTGQNLPRQAARLCGLERLESAFVVNEMCGSSLEAVILGAASVRAGEYTAVLAGGVEALSAAPFLIRREQLIEWRDLRVEEIQDRVVGADVYDALWCRMHDVHTIVHAEETTREWVEARGLDPAAFRLAVDEQAVRSRERAVRAVEEGLFREEIVPVDGAAERDELPARRELRFLQRRRGTRHTPEGLYLTQHNCPPLADGAAFLLLMDGERAREQGLEPLGTITGYARAGVEPERYLLAPALAVRRLLEKTGTRISDYDLLEMNTAFGSQILINQAELDLDLGRVNVTGDAVALGHPIGAAGARLLTTLLHALRRTGGRRGLVSICLGGGNALALTVERSPRKEGTHDRTVG